MATLINKLLNHVAPNRVRIDEDMFRPTRDPSQSIYDAFVKEAAKRKEVPFSVWSVREIDAVHAAAAAAAEKMGLIVPTREQVEAAERYARGSADYGAKWAYRVTDRMTTPRQN